MPPRKDPRFGRVSPEMQPTRKHRSKYEPKPEKPTKKRPEGAPPTMRTDRPLLPIKRDVSRDEYSPAELATLKAIAKYKSDHHRPIISIAETLDVLRSIGWREPEPEGPPCRT